MKVILGSLGDLHPGIHGSLLAHPPDGIEFIPRSALHTFIFDASVTVRQPEAEAPFRQFHLCEAVRFRGKASAVHSARWPVLGRTAWVTDMDDFGYPMLAGRHALSAEFRARFRRKWSKRLEHDLHERVSCMLRAYAHPSCRAIMFRTQRGIDGAATWIDRLKCGALGEAFIRKTVIVRPAQPTIPKEQFLRKWKPGSRLRVVMCARDFPGKGSSTAPEVLAGVASQFPACEFVIIGAKPQPRLGPRVVQLGVVPREVVLQEFARSHVVFHPAERESVGMVLIEAAAAGMAVVGRGGTNTSHYNELLPSSGLAQLRGTLSPSTCALAFKELLTLLLANRPTLHAMALANYQAAESGPISVKRRNAVLKTIYQSAARSTVGRLSAPVSYGWSTARLERRYHISDLMAAEESFRRRTRLARRAVFF